MVQSRQDPVADRFVVKPAAAANQIRRAAESPRSSSELDGSGLRIVQLKDAEPNPRTAWRTLLDADPSLEWAAPVLIDRDQHAHFPTGDVSVRFDHALAIEELEHFAAEHRVRVLARNEFVPEQVSFRPLQPREEYLPDLVRAIGDAPGVRAAWANTSSRYQRA